MKKMPSTENILDNGAACVLTNLYVTVPSGKNCLNKGRFKKKNS